MSNQEINTMVLSKNTYDNLRNANIRANMLLESILKHLTFADESDTVQVDGDRILQTIEICYPDSLSQRVSTMKRLRTKERMREIGNG